MERIQNSDNIPQLACSSDCDLQDISEESTSQHFNNNNIFRSLYDSFSDVEDSKLENPDLQFENDHKDLLVSNCCESIT